MRIEPDAVVKTSHKAPAAVSQPPAAESPYSLVMAAARELCAGYTPYEESIRAVAACVVAWVDSKDPAKVQRAIEAAEAATVSQGSRVFAPSVDTVQPAAEHVA